MTTGSAVPDGKTRSELEGLFARAARSLRGRLLARSVLAGASVGLVAGALLAAALWWQRAGALRPWAAPVAALGGALGGLALGRRRRLPDGHVALFLDARFGSQETITTALEL